jgi:Glycogen debranching enzyme N terminal
LEQRLWMRHGENTTYVEFTRIGGSKAMRLMIEPLCTYRDYHWQLRGERAFRIEPIAGGLVIQAYEGARSYRILSTGADVAIQPLCYWNFKHREESARGLDDLEDLLRPASIALDLEAGQSAAVIQGQAKPQLSVRDGHLLVEHERLGTYHCYADSASSPQAQWILTENATNVPRLYAGVADGPFKDAFHEYLINGRTDAVSANREGTKAAAAFRFDVPAQGSVTVRLRLSRDLLAAPWGKFDPMIEQRIVEADQFYADLQREIEHTDARLVQRQALAGMIWNKQYFYFDIPEWINGDPGQIPPPAERRGGRNHEWMHLNNADIISMPDKWEYPWYASWDLAFHTLPLALIDSAFAREQLLLLTREWYMHPNGQIPAYEWAFGDVNPPVHAWATWRVYQMDRNQNGGKGDLGFLERVFHKLMLNFTWWVNRKDAEGRNVFQGGFLGLDNIGVFDRSAELPTGGHIDQADGTSWMARYTK